MKSRLMKIKLTKKQGIIAIVLVCTLLITLIIPFTSSAKMVDVYTKSSDDEHLKLEWATVYDAKKSSGALPRGQMISQMLGTYQMETNSWGSWYTHDACHFAYTNADFNTGSGSVLTIKTTVEELIDYKQFGIMVRKSLDADSESCWINFDSEQARVDYREEKGENCTWAKQKRSIVVTQEKLHLKVVINKGRGVVELYIKNGGDIDEESDWSLAISKSIKFIKSSLSLYVGIAMATEEASVMGRATFSDFSVNLQAPEGYVVEDGGEEDPDPEKPPEVELPEDLAAAGDALLYETFTDGDMFPKDEKEVTVSNPLWIVRTGMPVVKLNESKNNRFLFADISDDPMFIETGDMEWTDYSVQMEVVFPDTVLLNEVNRVRLMVRQRTAYAGGVAHYGVTLYNKFNSNGEFIGQYLALDKKQGATKTWIEQAAYITLQEFAISETQMLSVNDTHTIKVEAFDNTIKVYLNDLTVPVIDYVDNCTGSSRLEGEPYLLGGIGLIVENATVQIDNIVVRKLYDPLGGDYDNSIMGDYDKPIPEWIEKNYLE